MNKVLKLCWSQRGVAIDIIQSHCFQAVSELTNCRWQKHCQKGQADEGTSIVIMRRGEPTGAATFQCTCESSFLSHRPCPFGLRPRAVLWQNTSTNDEFERWMKQWKHHVGGCLRTVFRRAPEVRGLLLAKFDEKSTTHFCKIEEVPTSHWT